MLSEIKFSAADIIHDPLKLEKIQNIVADCNRDGIDFAMVEVDDPQIKSFINWYIQSNKEMYDRVKVAFEGFKYRTLLVIYTFDVNLAIGDWLSEKIHEFGNHRTCLIKSLDLDKNINNHLLSGGLTFSEKMGHYYYFLAFELS